jgi:hypothetical protein
MKIKKIPIIFFILGFFLLLIGLLIISNKDINFFFIRHISNFKNISPYYLSNNSFPIYILWLKKLYIAEICLTIFAFFILLLSSALAIKYKYSNLFFLLFVFFFTLIISYFFIVLGADPHHDGIMFKPAIDVIEGKLLFKESFTQYGALTTYLQSFSILIFGKYLLSIRLLTALFYSIISILLFLIFSRFLNKSLNIFFCISWILLAFFYYNCVALPWSSVYAFFFQSLTSYFLIIFIEKKNYLYLFLTGVSVSLTFWCKQPVGVFLLIMVIIFIIFIKFLLKNNIKFLLKSIGIFISGFLIISLIFIIVFLMNNSLKDWWLQSIVFSFSFNSRVAQNHFQGTGLYGNIIYLLRCLFITGNFEFAENYKSVFIWQLFPIVNLIIFFIYLVKLFIKRILNKKEIIILSVVFISFASWFQYYPSPDQFHAFWAASPMIGLTVYFVWKIINILINLIYSKIRIHQKNKFIYLNRESKAIYLLKISTVLIILLLLFSYYISERVKIGFSRLEENQILINYPKALKGLHFDKDNAIKYYKLGKIIENLNENFKNKNIITTGEDALFLTFQENNINFSPMYVDWAEHNLLLYPDWREKLNNYIIKKKPIIIMIRGNFYADYFEIYSWDHYFICIPLELKNKYFSLFDNNNLINAQDLNKEQINSLNDSLKQQIALYGFKKLTFSSLVFDNLLKSIPMYSKSSLWLDPLIKNKISATNIVLNVLNLEELKIKLASYKDEEFIKFLYYFLFEREPDENGLKQWIDALGKGLRRDEVLKGFLESDEWKCICIEISLIP